MSDVSQGPGWWQAVDGKWYPPELHPSYQAPQVTLPPPTYHHPQAAIAQPAYQPPQMATPHDSLEAKSFLRSLYDFSFSSFITLRVIRVLYVLITIIYSLVALLAFVAALYKHTAADIVGAIIVIPLAYLIYLTFARIGLEILMVIFNIGKDVRAIRERGEVGT